MSRINTVFPARCREHTLFIDWPHGSPTEPVESNWTVFVIFIIFVTGTGQIAANPTEGVGFRWRQRAGEGSWIPDTCSQQLCSASSQVFRGMVSMWSPAEGVCSHIIASFGEKHMLTCILKCSLCSAKTLCLCWRFTCN